MEIPEQIGLRLTMHGHGSNGMAVYTYEDAGGLGIRMKARRENRRAPFIETWFLDALPEREFQTFAALREAALPITASEIEAVSARYPLIAEVKPDTCRNRCRFCPRPEPAFPRVHHDTSRVEIHYSWKNIDSVSLCAEHLAQFRTDPKGLREAIKAEAEDRIARAEASRLHAAMAGKGSV